MDQEERLRILEKESSELSIMVREWIRETRDYRSRREGTDSSLFNKMEEMKEALLKLPCETGTLRFKGLAMQVSWIWAILGVGGTAAAYAFIGHIFTK